MLVQSTVGEDVVEDSNISISRRLQVLQLDTFANGMRFAFTLSSSEGVLRPLAMIYIHAISRFGAKQ